MKVVQLFKIYNFDVVQKLIYQRLKSYFENIERILNLMDFRLFQNEFTLILD